MLVFLLRRVNGLIVSAVSENSRTVGLLLELRLCTAFKSMPALSALCISL